MKNFISFNAKYYKKERVRQIQLHNTRQSEIDYLIEPILANITDTDLSIEFDKKYALMKAIATKNKSYVKEYGNHILEAVVAISEDQAKQIIKEDGNADRLFKGFEQTAQDIKVRYGLEPLQVSLHLDEGHEKQIQSDKVSGKDYSHNIHCHITFLNYDFKQEKTVLRTLKKSDWENMQDISASAFKKHGMDFKRDKKKLSKGKDHLERNEFVAQQQLKDIESLQTEIDQIINNKKDIINDLKLKRKSLSLVKMDITDKKAAYKVITDEQRVIREDIKELRAKKKDILGFEFKLEELDSLKANNDKLTTTIETLTSKNTRLSNRVQIMESDSKALKDKNETLASDISDLKTDISILEKEFKFNYPQWKANRESRYSKFKKNKEISRK